MSWLTDPQAFERYPVRSAIFAGATGGLATGLIVFFVGGASIAAAAVTGAAAGLLGPLVLYRRFGHGYRPPSQARQRRSFVVALLSGALLVALGAAAGSVGTVLVGMAVLAFWGLVYRLGRRRR